MIRNVFAIQLCCNSWVQLICFEGNWQSLFLTCCFKLEESCMSELLKKLDAELKYEVTGCRTKWFLIPVSLH
ncbi:hypothetical protein JHK86_010687 [Glycine max]|nr:hypothetical protein JHK86_010687 [Glycine max]